MRGRYTILESNWFLRTSASHIWKTNWSKPWTWLTSLRIDIAKIIWGCWMCQRRKKAARQWLIFWSKPLWRNGNCCLLQTTLKERTAWDQLETIRNTRGPSSSSYTISRRNSDFSTRARRAQKTAISGWYLIYRHNFRRGDPSSGRWGNNCISWDLRLTFGTRPSSGWRTGRRRWASTLWTKLKSILNYSTHP